MVDEAKLSSDPKYKQFIAAIDKALKTFEYSSEWADLISCLGKLNKVIQLYSQYAVLPRKLLIGKRLAQCLHPALPSGVHLKALETYNLILSQIGLAGLAQDLFIYTTGLYPLLSQASMSVKPQLLDLYENHFLPLKKLLYPGLSGFLLALFPGIEEASEFSSRTIEILSTLCGFVDEEMFFTCLWDCVLHSSQTRLAAMTFVISHVAKHQNKNSLKIMGYDTNLMVNALCAAFDDTNVLTQRITLDFAITYISFNSSPFCKYHIVKLLTYALGVLLRRDMSLNRRIFQWFLNTDSKNATEGNQSVSVEDEEEDKSVTDSYFNLYSKLPLTAAVIVLFKDSIQYGSENNNFRDSSSKFRLKPFRILITLLDKPEVGSSILEEVMLEVFRAIYKHSEVTEDSVDKKLNGYKELSLMHAELIKNSNLLFNSFEPFFMWDYIGKIFKRCSKPYTEENFKDNFVTELQQLVRIEDPTHSEIFSLTDYLLDIVLLESATEVQTEHWPNLLKLIISETINNIDLLELSTLYQGICLISKLLSRLSPNLPDKTMDTVDIAAINMQKSPGMISPLHDIKVVLTYQKSTLYTDCFSLSKLLFSKFVEGKLIKREKKMRVLFQDHSTFKFDAISNEKSSVVNPDLNQTAVKTFQTFCRYLVQLACFPLPLSEQSTAGKENEIPDWLQVLISCCCNGSSFDVQSSAINALLDLVNVTQSVQPTGKTPEITSNIVPLISFNNLAWLECTNLYNVIAESLWNRINPETCHWHQIAVDLFLRLHNISPSREICENLILNSLVSIELEEKEMGYWRFSTMWHVSRDFYKEHNVKTDKGNRTLDKCMLLMVDGLQSIHTKIREISKNWIKHCLHFGDIGRVMETILLVLLHPTSARVAIHYSHTWPADINLTYVNNLEQTEFGTDNPINSQSSLEANPGFGDNDEVDERITQSENQIKSSVVKALPTHPLLIHKLLYTDHYDTDMCLYAFRCILAILNCEGRLFICAAATTSVNVGNSPHQSLLRELLIRHRRVLSGKEFYGSLAEAQQLLVRASTAKYIEILLSVCLYYIRSDFHERLQVNSSLIEGNFLVQTISAELLTKVSLLLIDIAKDSGKGFANYISDLMSRCKIQRIGLHCLLSTVYADSSDYQQVNGTGVYSMVNLPNLTSTSKRNISNRNLIDLQKTLLNFMDSLIHLEYLIGTENITLPSNQKNPPPNCLPFEYIPFRPIITQPMFISATLTVLCEKSWIHLHDNWISLVISCLPKFSESMMSLIIPVVKQICINLVMLTDLVHRQYSEKYAEIPVDYMIILLNGLTSISHFSLIGTSTQALMVSAVMQPMSKVKTDDISTSLFSNLVHVFSTTPHTKQFPEEGSNNLSDIKDGLLGLLPNILSSIVVVWKAWNTEKIHSNVSYSLVTGQPKAVRLCILQLLTPIAINYTAVFLASIADVWHNMHDANTSKLVGLTGKEWLSSINKRFLPDMSQDQMTLLEISLAIKALSLEKVIETSRQVARQLLGNKERLQNGSSLEVYLFQFLNELLLSATNEELINIKNSIFMLLKESLQLNLSPPSLFVLFGILNIFVHRVPSPDDRRARRDLQDLAQKYVESLNNIAGASLEGSAWFRKSLQVIAHIDDDSHEESSVSERSSVMEISQPSPTGIIKTSQFSVPALLILAEYFASMYDLLYLSEEKDKVAASLVYLLYNVIPYLKNHSQQNVPGYRACSALLAAVCDYQYTLRAWKKDVYELFLEAEFFHMDLISLEFWRTIIDRLITYDSTMFKDLMQKIALSQSGAINIFANREQEMEQRAQLLKRLSFIIFCGEFDQYHQYLPDIQERLAESIRHLQGPFLHEQVFLCFRVLLTRISPNHLVSLWPPILTELVFVFVHMEYELSSLDKPKSKTKAIGLESFLGANGYFKDPVKWLRLYLAVCKLLDFLLVLPCDTLAYYQVYKWAFSDSPGVYCNKFLQELEESDTAAIKIDIINEHKSRIRRDSKNKDHLKADVKPVEISKMAALNAPISQQQKQSQKEKKKKRNKEDANSKNLCSTFLPYVSRIVKIFLRQNLPEDSWLVPARSPGKLIIQLTKIQSIYDLMPFFLCVTGELAAEDVDVLKFSKFQISEVEELIKRDFIELT
ncbi:protein dopey-1 isoform X2 [Hydra vulgaris]|uniref:Protein dopey-1 isoform X2 n=1 Tax=Hydra vulgaris TaxID=6087 RepID=A0ABM4BKX8_HYDVU